MKETWKPVKNWENIYEISDLGRVKRLERICTYMRNNVVMHKHIEEVIYDYKLSTKSYILVTLKGEDKVETIYLHRLVANHFIINDDAKHKTQINHIDGNKHNNTAMNLEWCTPSYNTKHAYDTGLADKSRLRAQEVHGYKVAVYDIDDNLLDIFPSIRQASLSLDIDRRHIDSCCKGIKSSYQNRKFKYLR